MRGGYKGVLMRAYTGSKEGIRMYEGWEGPQDFEASPRSASQPQVLSLIECLIGFEQWSQDHFASSDSTSLNSKP